MQYFFRDILKADASVVDFHKQYFYELGLWICKLPIRGNDEINKMLVQVSGSNFGMASEISDCDFVSSCCLETFEFVLQQQLQILFILFYVIT